MSLLGRVRRRDRAPGKGDTTGKFPTERAIWACVGVFLFNCFAWLLLAAVLALIVMQITGCAVASPSGDKVYRYCICILARCECARAECAEREGVCSLKRYSDVLSGERRGPDLATLTARVHTEPGTGPPG